MSGTRGWQGDVPRGHDSKTWQPDIAGRFGALNPKALNPKP